MTHNRHNQAHNTKPLPMPTPATVPAPTKKLGIIGGLGPMATAQFYELIIKMTWASRDQEHIRVDISSRPDTPDRTAYILDQTAPDPSPYFLEAGQMLASQGADYLAIPCVTAHCYLETLQPALPVPVISLISETIRYLKESKTSHVGLLATEGTVACQIFQQACKQADIICHIPIHEDQQFLTHLIYDFLKQGKKPGLYEKNMFSQITQRLASQGATLMLLACTELALLEPEWLKEPACINTMAVLAAASVKSCGATLHPDYQQWIMPGIRHSHR